jgi:hypothetical protein
MDLTKVPETKSVESGKTPVMGDNKMTGLLLKNDLFYKLPPNLSVATRRVLIRQDFVKTQYTSNETATCVINSGELYCVPQTSYAVFELEALCPGTNVCRLGSSGALGVFRTTTARSQSGTEVCRSEEMGLCARDKAQWGVSENWKGSFGTTMGLPDPNIDFPNPALNAGGVTNKLFSIGKQKPTAAAEAGFAQGRRIDITANASEEVTGVPGSVKPSRFVVPLRYLWSMFNTEKLIPSQLLGGLRLECDFRVGAEAFVYGSTASADPAVITNFNYNIKNFSIVLDTIQLVDTALSALNKIAAKDSLEVIFTEVDHTRGDLTSTAINLDVRRAVSRAMMAYVKIRDNGVIANHKLDSLCSQPYDITSIQFQLGGLWYPNAPIKTREEDFWNTFYAFNKSANPKFPGAVSLSQFIGNAGSGTTDFSNVTPFNYNVGEALSACQIERSTVLGLSGLPISNSRVLRIVGTRTGINACTADIFMMYIKVAKTFMAGKVLTFYLIFIIDLLDCCQRIRSRASGVALATYNKTIYMYNKKNLQLCLLEPLK